MLNPLYAEFKLNQHLKEPEIYPRPAIMVCAEPCDNLCTSSRLAEANNLKKVKLKNKIVFLIKVN